MSRNRCKSARQLNKGESLHFLRRQLHYARGGKVTRSQPEQQNEQAGAVTLLSEEVPGVRRGVAKPGSGRVFKGCWTGRQLR
ncbi:Tn3 family transposase [Streptomyces sp. NWU339]|uniref:Tn3 family transposase n=1 Tax=Streptomyces sp. NWU339 TaxID=2185284 RepID=UPI0015E820FE|nr:Tn3 family transposase [Streptomyces sp. NWU339]